MSRPFSIIMPTRNNLEYSIRAIKSLYETTNSELFDLFVVDNNSQDGTVSYLKEFEKKVSNLYLARNHENKGFSGAINQGISASDGKYVVFLNNDIVLTSNWLPRLLDCLENSYQVLNLTKIGLVGPVSNLVAGRQLVSKSERAIDNLGLFSKQYYLQNHQHWLHTGFLSFFCCLIRREMIAEVGFLDERFWPGGFEDNDYVLRAAAKGWKSVIAGDTFVYHFGHKTFDNEFPEAQRGLSNRTRFYDKFQMERLESGPQKVVAMYRVKNAGKFFKHSLDSISPLVDEIVVLDDGSIDNTYEIAQANSKVVRLETQDLPLNEARDRDKILHWAQEREADWILVIDGDEVLSDGWTKENFNKLINPVNPMAKAYIFRYSTFWNDKNHVRRDNVWKGMQNVRLFKSEPEQHIVSNHPVGFHCNSTPSVAGENIFFAPTSMRIRHYGYLDPEDRLRKYRWYEKTDTEKNSDAIGAKDYKHLISEAGMRLGKWVPENTLALNMIVKNEGAILESFFEYIYSMFDEIIVVDTGSTDNSKEIVRRYGAKVFDFPWVDDFSAARNFAKEKTNSRWILHLDADETIPSNQLTNLSLMTEEEGIHGFLFSIRNYHPDGTYSISESIRLFKNLSELKYKGYVHETFDGSTQNVEGWTQTRSNVIIVHKGYLRDQRRVREKLEAYEKLNLKQVEDFPTDAKPYFSLGMHYLEQGKTEEALALFLKSRELGPEFFYPKQELFHFYLDYARKFGEEMLEVLPSEHPFFLGTKKMVDFIDLNLSGYPRRVVSSVKEFEEVEDNG